MWRKIPNVLKPVAATTIVFYDHRVQLFVFMEYVNLFSLERKLMGLAFELSHVPV